MKNYDIARCVLSVYNYRKDEDTNETPRVGKEVRRYRICF